MPPDRMNLGSALNQWRTSSENHSVTKTSDLPTYRSLRTRLLAVVAATGMLLTALIGGVSATSASAASAPLPALPLLPFR